MDELACFAPGMLALGSSGYSPDEAQKFLSLAEEVLLTYRASPRAHLGLVNPIYHWNGYRGFT